MVENEEPELIIEAVEALGARRLAEILVEHACQGMMLRRNLIYTGITRGKRLVVLVGQKRALALAVRASDEGRCWSKLREWLVRVDGSREAAGP